MQTRYLIILICLLSPVVQSVCRRRRIRKSWDSMSRRERRLYIRAVELGMERGYHMLFAEIHANAPSEQEAHKTCGFLLWHRRFLLAYENMLRSMGRRYECVTIPYWNYFSDYARYRGRRCRSLERCSRTLRYLGGSFGPHAWIRINKRWIRGRANNRAANDNFCQSSEVSGSRCVKHLPRGSWRNTRFPSGFGYSSLVSVLHSSTSYAEANYNLQRGPHNSIHSALGSTMATYMSPADIVFYSHHATIDMLHHLYYECHVGRTMSDSEKKTSDFGFGRCSGLNSESNVTMFWNVAGNPDSVEAHRYDRLRRFFRGVGTQYYEFVDNTDLGEHSYTYRMDHLVSRLARNGLSCPAGNPATRSNRRLDVETKTQGNNYQAEEESIAWYSKMLPKARKVCGSDQEALEQMELMECLYHDKHLGGVDDYSHEFRTNFGIKSHTRCKVLIFEYQAGKKPIQVKDWEESFKKPCK